MLDVSVFDAGFNQTLNQQVLELYNTTNALCDFVIYTVIVLQAKKCLTLQCIIRFLWLMFKSA